MTTTVTTVPYSGAMGTMPVYTASGTCPMMGSTTTGMTCPMMSAGQTCPMMGSTTTSAVPAYGYTTTTLPYSGSMYSMAPTTSTMPMYSTTMAAAPTCPAGSTMTTVPAYQAMTIPTYSVASATPYYMTPSTSFSTTNMSAACPANISPDSACLINQVVGLRNDVRTMQGTIIASSLQMQGQDLVSRINRLMAGEMLFRQQIAANPNLPNAQIIAFGLSQDADALNRDLAAFNQQLSMIPVDQRPYLAQSLSSFSVAYWDPAMQQFSTYRTTFTAQAPTAYQPAVAVNPWLTTWQTSYVTSLNNIASVPQAYASTNWWSTTRVLGSTEVYPGGTMMIPAGVVYIPAGSIGICQPTTTSMIPSTSMAVMPSTTTTAPTTAVAGTMETTTTTQPESTTTTTTTTTTPTYVAPTEQPGIGY